MPADFKDTRKEEIERWTVTASESFDDPTKVHEALRVVAKLKKAKTWADMYHALPKWARADFRADYSDIRGEVGRL